MKDEVAAWRGPAEGSVDGAGAPRVRGPGSALADRPAADPRVRPQAAAGSTYAALDLGTNNCRLLVARARGPFGSQAAGPQGAGLYVVDAFSRVVRLGE